MKLKAHEVDNYVKSLTPTSAPALILVYGPDAGGVYETVGHIAQHYLGKDAHPLQIVELSESALETPALLGDEAAAVPMFGAHKLVRVRGAGNRLTAAVKLYLAQIATHALVLIEADNLRPNSALRKIVETSEESMALPCYALDRRAVQQIARTYLQAENYRIESAALDMLADRLTTDRGIMQRELERLVLFKGPLKTTKNDQLGLLTLADIEAAIGDLAQSGKDALADNIALGKIEAADRILAHIMAAGVSASASIGAVRAHFLSLHQVLGRIENGVPTSRALAAFRPPLHFKRKPLVESQLPLWSRHKVRRALDILNQTEFECRARTGGNAAFGESLAQYTFLRLARAAKR